MSERDVTRSVRSVARQYIMVNESSQRLVYLDIGQILFKRLDRMKEEIMFPRVNSLPTKMR